MTPYTQGPAPAPALVPDAPVAAPGAPSGYVQLSFCADGRVAFRGSRRLLDWLLQELAEDGWEIELDTMRWCG